MKKEKIIYWGTTGLFLLMMLNSAFQYFTSADMKAAFVHLGFPDYFRVELAVAKFIGILAILIPVVPKNLKQFAYAGFFITIISAVIGHASKGDPALNIMIPAVSGVILLVSYIYFEKLSVSGEKQEFIASSGDKKLINKIVSYKRFANIKN